MLEKEREYVQEIENLNDQMGRMLKFVHTLIKLNNNNNTHNLHVRIHIFLHLVRYIFCKCYLEHIPTNGCNITK